MAMEYVNFVVLENLDQLEKNRKTKRVDQFDVREIENLISRLFYQIPVDTITA